MPKTYVYVINRSGQNVCKVGITKNIKARLAMLQTGSAETLLVACKKSFPSRGCAEIVERAVHFLAKPSRIGGEWFAISPSLADELVCSVMELLDTGESMDEFWVLAEQTRHQIETYGALDELGGAE